MAWTTAQQKVIDTRNRNVLVSAAAGSGKTAVLVERIITMISEGEHPIDIDRLLVVTFTNAAAAEMRGRIGKAIEEKLVNEPDNRHLQRQISLLQSAQITTIHSFCLNVIRNYFHRIDLDPSFKIAEESEITLMKSDVISDLLERHYEEGREDFHAFVESYSYSKSDAPIEDLILQLFGFSMSDPWPEKWINQKRRMFEISSVEEMCQSPWMKELLNYVKAVIGDMVVKNERTLEICHEPGGPTAYENALLSDLELLEELNQLTTYEEYLNRFATISFARLSTKKEEGVDPNKKEQIKAIREEIKKGIKDLNAQFFFQSPEEMVKDIQEVGKVMQVLFDLTLEFMHDFAKKKEEKNLIDFNDLEHFALKILIEEETGAEEKNKTEQRNKPEEVSWSDGGEEPEEVTWLEKDVEYLKKDHRQVENHADLNQVEEIYSEVNYTENYSEGEKQPKSGLKAGMARPTQAALELSEQFEEILIDEYQDSNMVQETILRSISREDMGAPNRFMVGDVKQSIYKFRLAMPEIFMEKYYTYSGEDFTEEGQENRYQRIDLDKNFRSRKIVLDYVNRIFEQIMQESMGGIIYDESASLKYGELFEETLQSSQETLTNKELITASTSSNTVNDSIAASENAIVVNQELFDEAKDEEETLSSNQLIQRIPTQIDVLLVTEEEFGDKQDKQEDAYQNASETDVMGEGASEDEEDLEEAVYTKKELEARMIARKIKELTDPHNGMLVFDKKAGGYRPAVYKDIVILLRSISGWSEVFVNTLMQEGISAYADTGTGYFQTLEIMTLLNMLRIIDNPRQDIPLTGVLYSPIVGLSTTELAMIRATLRNVSMYTALLHYAREGSNQELKDKITKFLTQLEGFRGMVNHKPLHELIHTVLEETGYYYYVSAMVGGDRRKANIDMLVSKAVRFEKGAYTGLFHFIRYMEKLNKYEVDFGEASTSGEQDNTVRIMSIHKSKGLEFPIVFVAGMSKQFNTQDLRNSIVLHSEMGVGPECVDSKLRTKIPTLIKKVIQKKIQIENLGEELRVLYVALTRPKEKLILTGYLKSLDDIKKKDFSFFELMSAKSYLDWVLPATMNRIGLEGELDKNTLTYRNEEMSVTVVPKSDLVNEEVTRQIFLRKDEQELRAINSDTVYDSELKEELRARLDYQYPYQKDAGLKVKMTVSELKKLGQFQDEEQSVNLYGAENRDGIAVEKKEGSVEEVEEQSQAIKEIGIEKLKEHKTEEYKTEEHKTEENKAEENKAEEHRSEEHKAKEHKAEEHRSEVQNAEAPKIESSKIEINKENPQTVPNFIMQRQETPSGTDRGTLYHKVLELLDLTAINNKDDVDEELERMVNTGRVSDSDIKKLKIQNIKRFALSDTAKRMKRAALAGKLFKEKQFVIGIKASEVRKEYDSDELILIQGIIDVYFEEDGELVLLDYKSDLIQEESQLITRYKVQLEYYKRALEQMFDKKVKEMILYSLSLGKEIRIEG